MEATKEYIQFSEPDKEALAKLLAECKGADRTMAQFAEVCGISPSTLSRIVNGNITKPLSEDFLKAIFDNKAEGCKVEIDLLYRANGMLPRDERNRMAHGVNTRRIYQETLEQVQQILISELLRRGFAVKANIYPGRTLSMSTLEERTNREKGDLLIRGNLMVTLPELDDLSEWVFHIFPGSALYPSYMEDRDPETKARMMLRRTLQMREEIFLIDAWQPERLKGMKYSWVFTNSFEYDAFKDYFRTAKLNNAMSMILIDVETRIVLKEEWMNCPMRNDSLSLFRDPRDNRPGTDYRCRNTMDTVNRNDDDFWEDNE